MNRIALSMIRCLMALGLAFITTIVSAAQFPEKPVRLIVPFPPGGTTDILAREVAQLLGERWGQPVVVDNRSGASGAIGSEQLKAASSDGYTLMITATHHVINPSLRRSLPYNTKSDFTNIALIATVPNVLLVHPGFEAKSVAELIRLAKEEPGKIPFGSTGVGGANHLAGELFNVLAGVKLRHIPYKGAAPAMNDLIAGHVPVMFDGITGAAPQLEAGRLRALGVTTRERIPTLPDVPTIEESGVKGYEVTSWFGLYGPPKMSSGLLSIIAQDVQEVLSNPGLQGKFSKHGAVPGKLVLAEFDLFVRSEIDKWAEVIEAAGIPKQ